MVISYFGHLNDETIVDPLVSDKMEFLRIYNLAVEVPKAKLTELSKIPEELNQEPLIKSDTFISRLTLSEKKMKQHQIKKEIQQNRRKYDLIIVEPTKASTAAYAVRDNRVDYVRIDPKMGLHTYNKRYSKRLIENSTMIEIDLSIFFDKYMARYLRPLLRILETFEKENIPVWLTNLPEHPQQLRSYQGLQSLGRIIGLSNKQTNSKYVLQRVERNRKKIEGKIPFPGVEINGSQD